MQSTKRKIERYGVTCWLINTGWVGGPYGIGKRISIHYTRSILDAALSGSLAGIEYSKDPIFGFMVPKHCPEVPDEILNPALSWPNTEVYFKKYRGLASRFIDNFKKFESFVPDEVKVSGPKL